MNKHTIWTRYYTPREFYRGFERDFTLEHYRGLCVFAPPPYLTGVRERHSRVYELLWRIDRRTAGWPLLRSMLAGPVCFHWALRRSGDVTEEVHDAEEPALVAGSRGV